MTPLVEVLTRTTDYLKQRGVPSARLDAELILGHVLGLDRVKVYLNFDRPMADAELEAARVLVRRRGQREPLAWIVGHKEFYDREFDVGPGVLVPRPDTETLVEVALEWIAVDTPDPTYVADIGSGTGCIGLTLALERPALRLYAIDLSDAALAMTRTNIDRHGLKDRVAVRRGDGLAAIPADRPVDWVVANPPYIPTGELAGLEPEVRVHEPRLALDGGTDGLDAYRALAPAAAKRARQGLLVEVGRGQAEAVAALFVDAGLVDVIVRKDLAGTERVVAGRVAGGRAAGGRDPGAATDAPRGTAG